MGAGVSRAAKGWNSVVGGRGTLRMAKKRVGYGPEWRQQNEDE